VVKIVLPKHILTIEERTMTQKQYIINRQVNILDLGRTLGNISEACRRVGVRRQHYYDIKKTIEEEGLDGLREQSRRSPRIGNRAPLEIEQKVLDYSHGQTRTANELKLQGVVTNHRVASIICFYRPS
jgi:winged helix-turn helix protein